MNPTKSFLEDFKSKFLWFIVTSKELYLDPDKIKVIQAWNHLEIFKNSGDCKKDERDIQWFISNLLGLCQPFTRLMKNDVLFL